MGGIGWWRGRKVGGRVVKRGEKGGGRVVGRGERWGLVTLRWITIPSWGGSSDTLSRFMLWKQRFKVTYAQTKLSY